MHVHFAIVLHDYGTTGFAAETRSLLLRDILDWVKGQDTPDLTFSNLDSDASISQFIDDYFERNSNEILYIEDDDITMRV